MKTSGLLAAIFLLTSCASIVGTRTTQQRSYRPQVSNVAPMMKTAPLNGPRKRLLVLPFLDNDPKHSFAVAEQARRSVVQSLLLSGQFLVVKNSDFPRDLNQLKSTRNYNLATISKTAKGLGIAGVVEGTIIEIKARRLSDQVGVFRKVRAQVEAKVRIRVMAAKTGREVMDEIKTATVRAETTQVGEYQVNDRQLKEDPKLIQRVIEKAFRGTIMQITLALDKLEWEGRIALVKGERIYLNAGRLSGLQVGDILKVMEDGEEVFDPETGSLIGRVPGRMKGTVELISYFGKDGAIGIIHSGSGFAENDRVELY